jgi:Zn-dependent protease
MNGIRLFRVFGITVYLHWTWFLAAAYEIQSRYGVYHSVIWNMVEYLMLFGIVLLHEFGHALACRSVGGSAERIMLWPLGGIAYVSPPPRPGAVLWSIAAGPLVNVALLILSTPILFLPQPGNAFQANLFQLIESVATINIVLLVFNLLPIYPLDGGQILQSLLWFLMGRGRSLAVVTVIGAIGSVALAGFALVAGNYWLVVMAIFAASQCWTGWQISAQIRERENLRPRPGVACPACGRPPLVGRFWTCAQCNTPFDTFETGGVCPQCGHQYDVTECFACRQRTSIHRWRLPITTPPPVTPIISPGQGRPERTGWM